MHLICSLSSYLAFLVAFVTGVMFLIQDRQLKHKHMGWWFHRLPALGTLDRANYVAIAIGFSLLTVGVVSGFIGAKLLFGRWWSGDPKEYLTVAVWVGYCVLWLVRMRTTLRGRRVALLSILGFSLVFFTFVGASWIVPSWHAFI